MAKLTPKLTLTSYNMGDVTEADFTAWVAFVCLKIDERCGFSVDIEVGKFGEPGDDKISDATQEEREVIQDVKRDLWDAWCAQEPNTRKIFKRLPAEQLLMDTYPMHPGYVYIVDNVFTRMPLTGESTTVGDYKRTNAVREIRRCELFARKDARLGDRVEDPDDPAP